MVQRRRRLLFKPVLPLQWESKSHLLCLFHSNHHFASFFGTLIDSDVLQSILYLSKKPLLRKAATSGFRIKMWGNYPALIHSADHSVEDKLVYQVETESQFRQLREYETSAYSWCYYQIILDEGTRIVRCLTFY
jgi:Gamma-glutamyl cyclotransferase, AIG2-like